MAAPGPPARTASIGAWFADQYKAAVGLGGLEGGAAFRRLAAAFPVASGDPGLAFPVTSRQRVMSSFLHLNLRYSLGRAGYAWLALTAAPAAGEPAVFAVAFWRRGGNSGAAEPEYISVAPTFESRDGEYRSRCLCYPAFARACDGFARELAPFEEAVLALAAQSVLHLDARASDPALTDRGRELRLAPLALAAALALDLAVAVGGALPAHTSVPYLHLLGAVAAAKPGLAERSEALVREAPALFNALSRGSADSLQVTCGLKLVPMSLRDVMEVRDETYAAWRELAAAQAATDLVINFVAPGAPLHGGWAYVEGAGPDLYENPAMAARFQRSAAAAEALASLREARRRLVALPATRHVDELRARLFKDITFAQSFLLMSSTAMLHAMENVGWSLAAHGAVVRRAPAARDGSVRVTYLRAFATEDAGARLLFDLAYTARCLHAKLGIAHTDLHSNNVTYFEWGVRDRPPGWPRTGEPFYTDPLVAYVAGPRGEADTFLFPAAGDGCFIVDFSRCILGPAFRARLEAGHPGRRAEAFYRGQTNRALRALARYAPEFVVPRQAALKAALLSSFDAAFEVLCLVDFIALGANVGGALRAMAAVEEKGDLRRFEVAPRVLELAAELERAAREAFIEGLAGLAAGKPRPKADVGAGLLRQVFGDWLFPRWAARAPERLARAQLVDAFNYNNELKATCSDYERFPPWARLETIAEHLAPLKLEALFERGPDAFLASLGVGARVEVVAAETRAEQEKLDGPPAATSSWLDD
ncbi:MAG TPA: hypothetical protein VNI01_10015 [Elusimicrobiota bacterium]|jgi:hypothetical protein|nr:hypothetical protein [Elusimicrobiota bacterium]